MDNTSLLSLALNELNLANDDTTIKKLIGYLDFLYDYNKNINLVGTKNKKDILIRHLIDSISLSKIIDINNPKKILDVGTGAGLPGIPLAIIYKDIEFYLLEAKKKAIIFLKKIIDILCIKNINILEGRAEEIIETDDHREGYDLVTSRALTKIDINLELVLPYCKIGGLVSIFKSKKGASEIDRCSKPSRILGGAKPKMVDVIVPFLGEYRAFLTVRKISQTKLKYPRKYGIIKKSKLV